MIGVSVLRLLLIVCIPVCIAVKSSWAGTKVMFAGAADNGQIVRLERSEIGQEAHCFLVVAGDWWETYLTVRKVEQLGGEGKTLYLASDAGRKASLEVHWRVGQGGETVAWLRTEGHEVPARLRTLDTPTVHTVLMGDTDPEHHVAIEIRDDPVKPGERTTSIVEYNSFIPERRRRNCRILSSSTIDHYEESDPVGSQFHVVTIKKSTPVEAVYKVVGTNLGWEVTIREYSPATSGLRSER